MRSSCLRQVEWSGGFPILTAGIIYYRTVDDYRNLRELSESASDFVVIGCGFIGSEIAAALAMNEKRVTMIFPENAIGARVYPPALAEFLNSYYREKGVNVLASETIKSVRSADGKTVVTTGSGQEIKADGVVAGLGIVPNAELAAQAGLVLENGIVVDEFLRTSNPDIYAAGDVANFYSPLLEKRMRVEHEDNANTMGEMAGRDLAGESAAYHHQPFFYSDLFDLGYEAVGDLDSSLGYCRGLARALPQGCSLLFAEWSRAWSPVMEHMGTGFRGDRTYRR